MRRFNVNWTAERDGVRHAFRPRSAMTLCAIRVDERHSRNDQPRCPACVAAVEREEGANAKP